MKQPGEVPDRTFHVKQSPPSSRSCSGSSIQSDFEILSRELEAMGLDPGEDLMQGVLTYWELLRKGSAHLNLISAASRRNGLIRHVADSLLPAKTMIPPGATTLLDLGSGGGLPGIPLALTHTHLRVTLLEARERKADWLFRAVRDLGAEDRIQVRCGRFEHQSPQWFQQYQLITARAVAPPSHLLGMVLPHLPEGSHLLLWHSKDQKEQIEQYISKTSSLHDIVIHKQLEYSFKSIEFISCLSSILRRR